MPDYKEILVHHDLKAIKPQKVRLLIAQFTTSQEDWEQKDGLYFQKNLDSVRSNIDKLLTTARQYTVDMVIFPELSVPSQCISEIQSWSRETGATVIAGSHYHKIEDNYISRCPIIVDGEVFFTEKTTPAPSEKSPLEGEGIVSGNKIALIRNSPVGNFGVLICSDYLNSNVRRILIENDIDILCVPAFQNNSELYYSRMNIDCEESENGIYIVYANMQYDKLGDGRSALFGKMHKSWLEQIRDKGLTDMNPFHKIFEMRSNHNFVVVEVDLYHKRPFINRNVYSDPNVFFIKTEIATDHLTTQFSKSIAHSDERYKKIKKSYSPSALPYYSEIDRKLVSKNRLENINQALSYLQENRLLLFSGLAGVGKTTLARSLVDFVPVNPPFWFTFTRESETTLEEILEELAGYLNTPEIAGFKEEKRSAGKVDIRRLTDELQNRDSTWIFFDDLSYILDENRHFKDPNLEMLFKSLRNNTHEARIIITSRILPLLNTGESLIDPGNEEKQKVEGLKTAFAIEYLKEKGLLDIEYKKLEELVNSVAGHPLALKLLIENVKEYGIQDTLNDLSEYKASEKAIIEKARRLFEKVARDEKELLERISVYRQPEEKDAIKYMFTENTSRDVLKKLLGKSLLETDHNGKYWLHPLVQEFAYNDLRNKEEVHLIAANYHSTLDKTYGNIEKTIYDYTKLNKTISEELIKYLLKALEENPLDISINLLIISSFQNNNTTSPLFFDLIEKVLSNQPLEIAIKRLAVGALVRNKDLDAKKALNILIKFIDGGDNNLRHKSIDLLGKFFDKHLDKCIDIIYRIILYGSSTDLDHLCDAIQDSGCIDEKFTDVFKRIDKSDKENITPRSKSIAVNYLRKCGLKEKSHVSEIFSSLESMDPYESIAYLDDLIFDCDKIEFNKHIINNCTLIKVLENLYKYNEKYVLSLIKKLITVSIKAELGEETVLLISTVLLSDEGFYYDSVKSFVEDDNLYVRIAGFLTVVQAYSCAIFFKNKYAIESEQFENYFKLLEKNSIKIMEILKKDNYLKEMATVFLQEIENPSQRQKPKESYKIVGELVSHVFGQLTLKINDLLGYLNEIDTQKNPIHMMVFAVFMSFTNIESEKIYSVWMNKKDGNLVSDILISSFDKMRSYPSSLLSIVSKISRQESNSLNDKRYLVYRASVFLIAIPNETINLYDKLLSDSSYGDKDLKIMIIFALSLLPKWVYFFEKFSTDMSSESSLIKINAQRIIQNLLNDENEEVRFLTKNSCNEEW